MKYFLPDWEDRLDPKFDFIKDTYSQGHKKSPYDNDIYAHQLFNTPPYDGLLVSLSIFESKLSLKDDETGKYEMRNNNSVREYLKIPRDSALEVMGDCGAFGYVNEKNPPLPFYSIENVSRIYNELGFDYGVSVDHLVLNTIQTVNKRTGKKKIITVTKKEKDRRIKLTLDNAKKFLTLNEKEGYEFTPIGVTQGYDVETYKESLKKIVEMGYTHIALGGLVKYTSEFILSLLKAIQPYINGIDLHLFGVLRPKYLNAFEKCGVTSFDSASYLRKAWLRSGQNYLSSDGKWYAAIRVPQSTNPRLLKYAQTNGFSDKDLKEMETNALNALLEYDQGKKTLEQTLNLVLEYDKLFLRTSENGNGIRKNYIKTLEDKPWIKCSCDVCTKLGIQVAIFRGCNRNKRRGFHNTWIFHNNRT